MSAPTSEAPERREIPRAGWGDFLEEFVTGHGGDPVLVEVAGMQTERLPMQRPQPLRGLRMDDTPWNGPRIGILVGVDEYQPPVHTADRVTKLEVRVGPGGEHEALVLTSGDGPVTTLRLTTPM